MKTTAGALHPTACAAKEAMDLPKEKKLVSLADKGFYNAEQLHACRQENIITYVPQPDNRSPEAIPVKGYRLEDFSYHKSTDTYTCPQGHTLSTTGQWYKKCWNRKEKKQMVSYLFKHYKTPKCIGCPAFHLCTVHKTGRVIERSEYAGAVEANNKRLKEHKDTYLRRQQIVEHPFGTIKRAWGYSYTLLKGLKKVGADLGLVYLCYNLKRVMNILTPKKMLLKLQLVGI